MSLGPLMIGIAGTTLSPAEELWLKSPLLGGVILFTRNFSTREQLEELVRSIHDLRSPSLLVAVDQEGGRVQRFEAPFTRLPSPRSIGHVYDSEPDLAESVAKEVGWLMAAELRACDIDLSFAPVVDLDRGLAAVIGDRAFHESPNAVARLAGAYVAGMREAGMVATAKHFPTHAGAATDSHTGLATDHRDFPDLVDDLLPYKALIESGIQAVMMAHVSFPELDPAPASLSAWWIGRELRSELGFGGVVISDDLGMAGASTAGPMADRAESALAAGCDLILICNEPEAVAGVLDRLGDYNNPSAQLRLMRLRGTKRIDWHGLRASARWGHAIEAVRRLESIPKLQLEG
jgi:beta-N-acetylhexosaminidase